jgi:hypothetical protein
MVSTFSEMAEAWMRENLPIGETPQAASEAMSSDSLDAWRPDFARWRAERCVSRQGYKDSAGIGCLLVDFAEWCIVQDAVPCQRATFERLLTDAGFRCADGMASGLILRADLEAVLRFQAVPEGSPAPERATAGTRRNAKVGSSTSKAPRR